MAKFEDYLSSCLQLMTPIACSVVRPREHQDTSLAIRIPWSLGSFIEVKASESKSSDKFWSITRLTSVGIQFIDFNQELKLGVGRVSMYNHVILGFLAS